MLGVGNVKKTNTDITTDLLHVDFTQPHLCERTVPVSCSICGSIISLSGRQSWSQLLVAITEMFITKNNPNLELLYHHSLNSRSTHPFFMDKKLKRHNCARLSNGKWIDLNYSIPRLIDIIGKLCVFCGVGLEDVQIYYKKKGATELQDAAAFAQQENITVENEISATGTTSRLTIREAIVRVLQSSQQGMTIEEIYNKIIADRLYSFDALNPQNVIRVEIERACVNSNYTIRANTDCFRFERNHKGEKVYFLLSSTLTGNTVKPSIFVDSKLEQVNNNLKKIEFWNDSIERNFRIWMKSENYTSSTIWLYCSSIKRAIQIFKSLADSVISEANNLSEAIRKFISLLNQDSKFNDANSTAHGYISIALATLARFIDSNTLLNTASVNSPTKANNTIFNSMIVKVLSAHFSNGFRLNSPIELLRFRRFAAEDFGNEISITDEELIKSISSCGIFFNGKVYVIGSEVETRIRNNIDLAVSSGVEIIYYSSFYKLHEECLLAGGVISEKMLKEVLSKMYPKYMYKMKYFSPKMGNSTELAKIKREILRVWGSDVTLNYEQLTERLPFIPIEKIKYVLAQNSEFVWNSTRVYTHISKVDVTSEEIIAISNYVDVSCQRDGYVSLSDVPLDGIAERNYELSLTAIQNAVFEIILSTKYNKRGKIITRKGDTFDALTIMKEYCCKLDKCTLQDLFDFERELTGELHYWIPMEAAYSVMVRIDKNCYVAEKYVHFDVGGIDSILDLFVTHEYLPLKSITTFAAFPYCGQAWNLFLLESYCRRFSEKYRFEVLSVNSKNVGAIVRKCCRLSYAQIMADAVAKSDIPLEKEVIEEFLYNNGYLGRRSYSKINELIEQAKAIRERMD